ncbi:MAG: hypothetical protein FWD90_05840 [Defluviitaleaceae bacterium]|nr:hypothetical protein [Defluviitaleaceae bacterium]
MISIFGIVSFIIFAVCCAGLVLHYLIMKKRVRLDNALHELETHEADTDASVLEAKEKEYEAAYADYHAYVSRFPFDIIAKILNLPREQNE